MSSEDLAIIDAALQTPPVEEEEKPEIVPETPEPDSPIPSGINWQNLWRGAQVRFEHLPEPGGIVFPLIILVLFFLILIPINGHTRLTWLWLVLTGNASVGQGSGGGGSAGSDVNTPIAPVPAMPVSHVGGF